MLDKFLNDESTEMRFVRTVAQGLLSVFIVAVPLVMGDLVTDPTTASLVTVAIMCVASPAMAMFRTGNPEDGLVDACGSDGGDADA